MRARVSIAICAAANETLFLPTLNFSIEKFSIRLLPRKPSLPPFLHSPSKSPSARTACKRAWSSFRAPAHQGKYHGSASNQPSTPFPHENSPVPPPTPSDDHPWPPYFSS